MLVMWAGHSLLTAQKQILDSPWGSVRSWLIWLSVCAQGRSCLSCFTPWLQTGSHIEVISGPPKVGSGVCSAKFGHSSKHYEKKESQENPTNNASNEIFLFIFPYLLDHEDSRNSLISPLDSCMTISNSIFFWSQSDLRVAFCCEVDKCVFTDFWTFPTLHLGFKSC